MLMKVFRNLGVHHSHAPIRPFNYLSHKTPLLHFSICLSPISYNKHMKKIIFGIFAHPDDEAFGPGGALLLDTRSGAELHLITLTSGDAGTNPDNLTSLSEVRLKEWREAGKLLGASGMYHLGFRDGKLNNIDMLQAAEKIERLITDIVSSREVSVEVECMTLDLNGLTGHIDHIVATRATCLAFYRLKAKESSRYTRIRFACLPREQLPEANIKWLYMEAGRPAEEIDETVDARHLRQAILAVVRTHHTQRADGEDFLKYQGNNLGICHFIVKT